MENIVILAKGLKKSYGRVQALRGVDLQVQRGEIFGFLGPNGAGKTTAIRCMLDQIRPNGGELRVLDMVPKADPVRVRRRVGYLPGELHVEGNFTVESALRFFNRLRNNQAEWSFIRQLTDRLDLALKTPVKNLSKGNKQKIGLVLALMHKPELLLLDEPTFGLDPLMQQEVLKLVMEARSNGATVFLSSHILREVETTTDRVAIIRQGLVVEVAETGVLLNRSIRRVRIRFRQPVDPASILQLPGVLFLSNSDDLDLTVQVEGEMDPLIKVLAAFPVVDFETERPSLEEIFLEYYEKASDGGGE